MGKVLHASGSGYFPRCIPTGSPDTAITIKLTLVQAMTLFWRVKKFEAKTNGSASYSGGPNGSPSTAIYTSDYAEIPNFENYYPTPDTEEDIVCDANEGTRAFNNDNSGSIQQYGNTLPMGSFMQYSFNQEFSAVKESVNGFYYPYFTFNVGVFDTNNYGYNYVGNCNLSFYGYNGNLPLYANQGGPTSSANIVTSIRAKEYYSYGGTYNTSTGEPL